MLTELQLLLITSFVIPLLIQGFKLWAAWTKKDVPRWAVSLIVFLVSAVLGFFWVRPELPTTTDPVEFVSALLVVASAIMGLATLIYNVILSKVFEYFKWTKQALLKR